MGFFGREKISVPPHPRQEPRIDLPLCLESLEQVFDGCADFSHRAVDLGGDPAKKLTLCYIGGMVRRTRPWPWGTSPAPSGASGTAPSTT